MFVTFTTRERTFESQNRGFTALWEFSESFVKLGKRHLKIIKLAFKPVKFS